ncbi:MAG: polyprenyl synthetase family protein [Desulfobulbaceae bacterium]|nr:polyprenyl synthetase family protein [Desulfobulbaceae bacterium]
MTVNKTVDPESLKLFAKQTATLVENAMHQDLDQALIATDPLLRETLEHSLFNGGKRIRPLLVILSSRICGKTDNSSHLLAAAFEYLHVATLIHDDVIDGAKERRGVPSLVQSHGLAAAILTGDWLHARSMQLIGKIAGNRALEVFCHATTGMVDGEYLQIRHTGNPNTSEQQYFSVIARKTGGLIASACEIAGIFANASDEQIKALVAYGTNLGIAFQIVDDLLDYLGDQKSTGKKIGQDLVEGKMTLPLIRALANANTDEITLFKTLFSNPDQRAENLSLIKEIILKNDGFNSARATAEESIENAINALSLFTDQNENTSYAMLKGLALYVISRDK